jgi:hypothetical protein
MDESRSSRASTAGLGILVIVVATAVRAILAAVGLLVVFGVLPPDSNRFATPVPLYPIDTTLGLISSAVLLAILTMSMASVWGLLRREPWGWTLAIVTAAFVLTLNLATWMTGEPRYLSMLINSIAVFYLNQRDLRAVFGVGRDD